MKITREELRAIIKEEMSGSEELVQIQGVGTMERGQVISSLEKKLQDMIERNRQGNHSSLGQPQLDLLSAMWSAVSEQGE
jgi:hypothetical protein